MIKFFRKIRQKLLSENKFSKYLIYAIGEIVLVVIGILIALYINNWNVEKTDEKSENKYLSNIVLDLKKDIKNLNDLTKYRVNRLIGDRKIINHINGESIDNVNELAKFVFNSLMERNFTPSNTTFSELSNSGNLNLIKNDSIKLLLLELDELYKINKLNIEHETFDYREYISKPINKNIDVEKIFPVYEGTKSAKEQMITIDSFNNLLNSKEYKNGLFIMTFMSETNVNAYGKMRVKSEKIIELIERQK